MTTRATGRPKLNEAYKVETVFLYCHSLAFISMSTFLGLTSSLRRRELHRLGSSMQFGLVVKIGSDLAIKSAHEIA
jgi:hypothetical protein